MSLMSPQRKAVAYLRVSGKGQVEGDGFNRQRDAIRRFATLNGCEIVGEFRDEGVSGTRELADRPGLASLLERVESNGVHLVLVERADRLARDLMVNEIIIDQFKKAGATVLTAEGVDLTTGDDDPTRTLIRQVLGAVAQFEKTVIVLKLKAARERIRRRTGRCEGRKPFGTRPGEEQVLLRIRQLRRKPKMENRMSYAAIAAQLNTEGAPSRSGKPWSAGTVYAVIGNKLR
jgi:DNA invertase Pin-like site-specific DNA recombinase